MSKKGMMLIDEYIELVKSRLPDSIAEDIGSELKSYLEAAAIDLGQGTLTNESAKRAIAAFGAPADVASEYKMSLDDTTLEMNDTITDTYFDSVKESVRTRMVLLIALGHFFILPARLISYPSSIGQTGFGVFLLMLCVQGFGLLGCRIYFKRIRPKMDSGDAVFRTRSFSSVSFDIIISLFILIMISLALGSTGSFYFNYSFSLILMIFGIILRITVLTKNTIQEPKENEHTILVISGVLLCISFGFVFEAFLSFPFFLRSTINYLWSSSLILLPAIALETALTDTQLSRIQKRKEMLTSNIE